MSTGGRGDGAGHQGAGLPGPSRFRAGTALAAVRWMPHSRFAAWRRAFRPARYYAAAFLLGTIAAGSGALEAAWQPIARVIGLTDPPVPASANVLSEHETEALDGMSPQAQAELLLER